MKNIAAIFVLTLAFSSCFIDKRPTDPFFNWTHQNVPHHTTDAQAYISQSGLGMGPNQIVAKITSSGVMDRVNIQLSSLSPNTYVVSLSTNKFYYVDDAGNILGGAGGSVTIWSNTGNKLSGNFSVKLINSSSDTTLIEGWFANIDLHP
jgi:hypothetical protein